MAIESIKVDFDWNLDQYQHRPIRTYLASPLTNCTVRRLARNRSIRQAVKGILGKSTYALFQLYDPADHTAPGSKHSARDVYRLNLRRTIDADLLLIHDNSASTGVGVEAQIASDFGIPRVMIRPQRGASSRMVLGMPSTEIATVEYENVADFKRKFADIIQRVAIQVAESMPRRRHARERARNLHLGRFILRRRIELGMTRAQLAAKCDVSVARIEDIEEFDELAMSIPVFFWDLLAEALDCRTQTTIAKFPDPESTSGLSLTERESLESLVNFVLADQPRSEERTFRLWRDFMEMQQQALAGRESLDDPYTEHDWRRLYNEEDGTLGDWMS